MLLKKILCGLFIIICVSGYAEDFVINKIQVNGLQRIKLTTVLSYLPVKPGDQIDSSQTGYIIRDLYRTNFFSDVKLKRQGNNLVIDVVEREVIGSIKISGNKKITQKQIVEVLKSVGLVEGQALDRAMLHGVVQALEQQYHNLGLYDAKVDVNITNQERNRVAITITIKEGPVAKIKAIKIVGNTIVKERTLLREISTTTSKPWSFFTSSDQYSKEKLDADLEKLRSYYMDRGYLHFQVDDVRVKITPDKKYIYITIYVNEGVQYRIQGVDLAGNLLGKRAELVKLITIKPGDVFSRKKIVEAQANIGRFLSDYGYGIPDIRIEPEVNNKSKQILIKFIIDPGRRIYIHRISFKGNAKTHDEVLRREMRLQEGSVFSLSKINESSRRLANLGYLKDIDYKVTPLQDSPHQVDLTYNVTETSAISAAVQGGYSDADGFLYGANINDNNVFGTGKSATIRFDNGRATQYYGLGYADPYFTVNGVGLALNAYFQKNDKSKMHEGSYYSTDIYGGIGSFEIPLSDYDSASLGLGIEHIEVNTPASGVSNYVEAFLQKHESKFNQFKVVLGWRHSNFDRAIFPTKGFSQGIHIECYGPLNKQSLEFYKANYNNSWYQPLVKDFIFHTRAEVGYGGGFGKTKSLPFFKNFFAGGIGSVRGFDAGSLGSGDKDGRDQYGRARGGNVLAVASASLIIPAPMSDMVRPSVFFDIGNVYNNKFKLGDLRSSYGIQVEWHTPLVPLVFSLAKPLREKPGDYTSTFQFSIAFSA